MPGASANFQKTEGYVATGCAGCGCAAPISTTAACRPCDLLEPPAERPARFYRGYDLIDPANGGFVSAGTDGERYGWLYDTTLPGNGNGGHLWGTDCPREKEDLSYLKTL